MRQRAPARVEEVPRSCTATCRTTAWRQSRARRAAIDAGGQIAAIDRNAEPPHTLVDASTGGGKLDTVVGAGG
ncbi:hypothetical protein [Streptomyces virginiae]|uniref:hypothetical protein n=1 Tax=Streptomyces virginiae TaxID=1961 RepID=UPI003648B105